MWALAHRTTAMPPAIEMKPPPLVASSTGFRRLLLSTVAPEIVEAITLSIFSDDRDDDDGVCRASTQKACCSCRSIPLHAGAGGLRHVPCVPRVHPG